MSAENLQSWVSRSSGKSSVAVPFAGSGRSKPDSIALNSSPFERFVLQNPENGSEHAYIDFVAGISWALMKRQPPHAGERALPLQY